MPHDDEPEGEFEFVTPVEVIQRIAQQLYNDGGAVPIPTLTDLAEKELPDDAWTRAHRAGREKRCADIVRGMRLGSGMPKPNRFVAVQIALFPTLPGSIKVPIDASRFLSIPDNESHSTVECAPNELVDLNLIEFEAAIKLRRVSLQHDHSVHDDLVNALVAVKPFWAKSPKATFGEMCERLAKAAAEPRATEPVA